MRLKQPIWYVQALTPVIPSKWIAVTCHYGRPETATEDIKW